jgi:hypothetical protein
LRFAPSPLQPRVTVYGGDNDEWRLVTVDVDQLRRVSGEKKQVGARLLSVDTSP